MIDIKMMDKETKYRRKYAQEINHLFQVLKEIRGYGEEYYGYVASVEAFIAEDYAETFDYDNCTYSELEKNYLALQDVVIEAEDVLGQAKKAEEHRKNLEIGNASIAFLGTDSLKDLDEVLRKNHEEKEQQKMNAVKSVTDAVSAIRGNGDVLANLFKSASENKQVEKDEKSTSESKGSPDGK